MKARTLSLLSKIDAPSDLKNLTQDQLEALATEIRSEMIEVVTSNGGHLASSLGAVELIIALHYVFEAPDDKIIFDVGHQAYAHKLLTGRRQAFKSLRLKDGLSGFPRREESHYDCFNSGHSSTSISASLGMAVGRDLEKLNHRVVAVIGDGALTGGMAMEAINHAGAMGTNLLVVFNDNRMSISHNVGALSQYLSLKLTSPEHIQLRERVKKILGKVMPHKGHRLIRRVQRAEEALKAFMLSPTTFMAAWGFKYLGPIDGHNFDRLIEAFKHVKNLNRPILLHVLTTKGKGFPPAEENPLDFHGLGGAAKTLPTAQEAGALELIFPAPTKKSYTDCFGDYLAQRGSWDNKLSVVTAAMSQGTGLEKFFALYPDRSFDVGIAEQHAVTFAAGLAAAGLRPVVAVYSTFLQRAFDQLFHDVALPNLAVVVAVDRAGLVGEDGPTHHGGLDLGMLRMLPNFTVMAPRDEEEFTAMLDFAFKLNGPVAIRYPRGSVPSYHNEPTSALELGRAETMIEGSDLTFVTLGQTVWPAMEAAKRLKKRSISAGVINLRFIKPLDSQTLLDICQKSRLIITCEENSLIGGLYGAVCELLASFKLNKPMPIKGLGLTDAPIAHASQSQQRASLGLDAYGLEKLALEFFYEFNRP
ncbi:MAG: 1-deoxy-D-xylulose-5-phosphate synthase [Deltaproteobacteria bacterium]|nr:1-deoxy-D-xylulose-5-phosphate synthase [Deltaproteobacteria bacterium]